MDSETNLGQVSEDKPIPPSVQRHYRRAAKQVGDLFCWCVINLDGFPAARGDWIDEVKRRLVEHKELQKEPAREG